MLFGNSAPKIVIDPSGLNLEIALDYSVITKDEPEEDLIIHQSLFTGFKPVKILGKYWAFELKMHLYKYETTMREVYSQLKSYEQASVRLYRHSDGNYFMNNLDEEVLFTLVSINEGYYKSKTFKDLLFLKFKSNAYIDMTKGVI